jgi:hypothetical protein
VKLDSGSKFCDTGSTAAEPPQLSTPKVDKEEPSITASIKDEKMP